MDGNSFVGSPLATYSWTVKVISYLSMEKFAHHSVSVRIFLVSFCCTSLITTALKRVGTGRPVLHPFSWNVCGAIKMRIYKDKVASVDWKLRYIWPSDCTPLSECINYYLIVLLKYYVVLFYTIWFCFFFLFLSLRRRWIRTPLSFHHAIYWKWWKIGDN